MSGEKINIKIGEWLGWQPHFVFAWLITKPDGLSELMPDWYGSDADAIKLLSILIEREYTPRNLRWNPITKRWYFDICNIEGVLLSDGGSTTISGAICSAIIDLVERGEG